MMVLRPARLCVCLAIGWAVVAAASLVIGTTGVSAADYWRQVRDSDGTWSTFLVRLMELPIPRLAMGTLAGAALSIAGVMFQSLFRNPLASPSTLGVESGASLGAAIAITLAGGGYWHGLPVVNLAAFAGAAGCMLLVYGVARWRENQATVGLLLAGLTVGFICSAMIVLVMFLAEVRDSDRILRWMMGSLEIVGMGPVYESLALIALAGGLAAYLHRDMDLLMMGEVVAAGRGVPVRRARTLIYFSSSLLTAAVVAHCGPIGFIGLLVPHICRYLVGATHRHLLLTAALGGAFFLPLCDLIARNGLWWLREESRQTPVGILTSLVGGSLFLYLVLFRRP